MATQTKTSNPVIESVENATERVAEFNEHTAKRVAELNEQAVANGKKAGAAILSSYEQAVLQLTDSYEKAAGATNVEWVASFATAQADLTREVTKAYASAAREFVA
jgi:uncharacterized iron-regulated protein